MKGSRKPRHANENAAGYMSEKKRSYARRSRKTDNASTSVTNHQKPNDSVIEGCPVFKSSDGSQYIVVNPAALTPKQTNLMTINQSVAVDRNGKAATKTLTQELNTRRSYHDATASTSNQFEGTKHGVGDVLQQIQERPAGPQYRLVSSNISNINGSMCQSPTVVLQNQNLYSQLTAPTKQLSIQTQKLSKERWSPYPNPLDPKTFSPTLDQYRSGYQPMKIQSSQKSAATGYVMPNSSTDGADSSDTRGQHDDNSAVGFPKSGVNVHYYESQILTLQQKIKDLEQKLKASRILGSQLNFQNFEASTKCYFLNNVYRQTMLRLRQKIEENEMYKCSLNQLNIKGQPETRRLTLQDRRSIQSQYHGTPYESINCQCFSNGQCGRFVRNGHNVQSRSNESNGLMDPESGFVLRDFNGSTEDCNATLQVREEIILD